MAKARNRTTTATRELLDAAKRGDATTLGRLLANGVDPNGRGKGRTTTALTIAAALGHLEAVRALLKAGANVNLQDRRGHDALGFAVKGGFTEIVKLLLGAGASVKTGLLNFDILAVAATMGHEDILKILLKAGANARGDGGRQALFWAIHKKHERIALSLIRAGVKLDSVDMAKQLVLAANNGMAKVVKLMLEAGVYPDIRDRFGKTAMEAAKEEGHSEVVQVLKEHRTPKDSGKTLIKAAESGDIQRIRALVQSGVDIEARDANGATALLRAVEKRRHKAVCILLEAGANPDNGMPMSNFERRSRGVKEDQESPLSLAASLGDLESVKILLNHKANLEREGCEKTACYCLLMGGKWNLAVVDHLLESGLNPGSRMMGFPLMHFARTADGAPGLRARILAKLDRKS